MLNIKCLIVDDESIAQRIISGYLDDLPGYEVVATCKNAMEAIVVLKDESIDLLFLDIEMPKLNGLEFLKTLSNPPAVIITTAHREYALEGYELEVLDYLLKPFSFNRFIKAVNRYNKTKAPKTVIDHADSDSQKVLYVKSERKTVKLSIDEITHVEAMNNYILIHTKNQRHVVYQSLGDILLQLGKDFIRVHKSFVVNTSLISSFTKEEIFIDETSIPIGKTYKHIIGKL